MVVFKIMCAFFSQRLLRGVVLQHPYQSGLSWQRVDQNSYCCCLNGKTSLNVCQRLPEGAKLFKTGCQLFIHGRFECFCSQVEVKFIRG